MTPAAPSPASDDDAPLYDRPSKSQVKRDMLALTDLGKSLVELSNDRLRQLPLSETLYEAIRLAQRTTSREGRRRQLHYVGKLMRQADADTIRAQLALWADGGKADTDTLHALEARRDALLASDDALTALLDQHPGTDVQQWRSVIRAARKEQADNARLPEGGEPRRKHYRTLFQLLKSLQNPTESA